MIDRSEPRYDASEGIVTVAEDSADFAAIWQLRRGPRPYASEKSHRISVTVRELRLARDLYRRSYGDRDE